MRFFKRQSVGWLVCALITVPAILSAEPVENDGAKFTAEGKLVKPANYREWILIGTGLGMAYGPLRNTPSGRPPFTNVFVNPSSYKAFLASGKWPDKTMFILEVRESMSVNKADKGANGHFQGEIVGLEAEVKDEARFPGKWGFYSLNVKQPDGPQIPTGASCYSCHATNAAVENTFVQFYPVLRDVAKEKGTFKQVPEVF
jgi:hypothetical protein